jgi:hypothetical protein
MHGIKPKAVVPKYSDLKPLSARRCMYEYDARVRDAILRYVTRGSAGGWPFYLLFNSFGLVPGPARSACLKGVAPINFAAQRANTAEDKRQDEKREKVIRYDEVDEGVVFLQGVGSRLANC